MSHHVIICWSSRCEDGKEKSENGNGANNSANKQFVDKKLDNPISVGKIWPHHEGSQVLLDIAVPNRKVSRNEYENKILAKPYINVNSICTRWRIENETEAFTQKIANGAFFMAKKLYLEERKEENIPYLF